MVPIVLALVSVKKKTRAFALAREQLVATVKKRALDDFARLTIVVDIHETLRNQTMKAVVRIFSVQRALHRCRPLPGGLSLRLPPLSLDRCNQSLQIHQSIISHL
jgi:hypothetical protein